MSSIGGEARLRVVGVTIGSGSKAEGWISGMV